MPETLLLKQDQFISRNLTLTANREHTLGGYTLGFTGGNIGFGIASPTARMHVVGGDDLAANYAAKIGGATTTGLQVRNDGFISAGASGGAITVGYGSGFTNTLTNTIFGISSGTAMTAGSGNNVAIGYTALTGVTSGTSNIGIGTSAGNGITTGYNNIVIGSSAGGSIGTGINNLSIGVFSMQNHSGKANVALGMSALSASGSGDQNVAIGHEALVSVTGTDSVNGRNNVGVGIIAGYSITTGYENTMLGAGAGRAVTTGNRNIMIGANCGYYETGSDTFMLHSIFAVSNEATARNEALLYGKMSGSRFTQRLHVNGSLVGGGGAVYPTNTTSGFWYVPSCEGTPTGTPDAYTGGIPMIADSTNNKLYIYSGGSWVALN